MTADLTEAVLALLNEALEPLGLGLDPQNDGDECISQVANLRGLIGGTIVGARHPLTLIDGHGMFLTVYGRNQQFGLPLDLADSRFPEKVAEWVRSLLKE